MSEMERVLKLVNTLENEWKEFRSDNDKRLAEIKAKGSADPLTEEKINKHSAAITKLEADLDDLAKKSQRRTTGGGDDPKAEAVAKHRAGFEKWARKGSDKAEAELLELQNALSTDSDPDGGFLVPSVMESTIEKFELDLVGMRQDARIVQASTEDYVKLVRTRGVSSGWVGEREARPATDAEQWAELKPYFGEIYAKPELTQKMLDDSAFDMEGELAMDIGDEFALQENSVFTTGNGVKKPKGILDYTLSTSVDGTRTFGEVQKVHSGSSGAFVADKMLDLVGALHPAHLPNARWQISRLAQTAIRKLKDGQNNYLLITNYAQGAPTTLLGYPITLNDAVPAPAADSKSAMFGDFRRAYTIVDVKGIRMLRDPYSNKPYVQFYTTKRVGGFVTNDRAVKVMVLSA